MKILHTSDWHLGAREADDILYDDQKHFIDEICDITCNEDVDVLIIAGDVYDRAVSSTEAIQLYDYAMGRLCLEMGKEVIIIAGNHDSAGRLAGCKDLLEKSGLHILGALEREPRVISYDDTDIYLLPWFTEEKVKGLFPEKRDEINSLNDAYKLVCEQIRATFDPAKKHMAVSHSFIANAKVSESDRSARIAAVGTALCVEADVFDGFDYVALGHLHGPQDINSTVRYSGTPMAYSFGREEKQEKSVTIIDTASMEKTVIPLHPLHERNTIEGTFDELLRAEYEDRIKNGYVRIKVTDQYVGLEGISQLRSIYPLCLEIQSKAFESESAGISMTMEELRQLENDPMAIFKSYCRDMYQSEPSDHMISLFKECLEDV